ncbi:hypothetical protein SAMN05443246_5219 [Paenibacillus sp. GP183]|jgi:hypothetical protein|nr:hypothetical protein SAMN05443246_5219 [Paenibacillus sp. GP183]
MNDTVILHPNDHVAIALKPLNEELSQQVLQILEPIHNKS